jgi:hypothetical protein
VSAATHSSAEITGWTFTATGLQGRANHHKAGD